MRWVFNRSRKDKVNIISIKLKLIVRFSSQKLSRKNRGHLQCAVISNTVRIKAAAWAGFARNREEKVAR